MSERKIYAMNEIARLTKELKSNGEPGARERAKGDIRNEFVRVRDGFGLFDEAKGLLTICSR